MKPRMGQREWELFHTHVAILLITAHDPSILHTVIGGGNNLEMRLVCQAPIVVHAT